MNRYVKKGGWGGSRRNAGRKTLSKLDRLVIVGRCQTAWEEERDTVRRLRPPKRLQASWARLNKVLLQDRELVLRLADQDEMPENVPPVVRRAVGALKKTRAILDERGRVRTRARPYAKREILMKRIAADESAKRGIRISWRQVRRWCDKHENLISG